MQLSVENIHLDLLHTYYKDAEDFCRVFLFDASKQMQKVLKYAWGKRSSSVWYNKTLADLFVCLQHV